MKLKIASPDKVIYTGEIEKITIPTQGGELTILANHQPLASVVKSGLVSFTPKNESEHEGDEYVQQDGKIIIALSKGMVFVDGENVIITTSAATTSPTESEDVLKQMQQDMQEQLEKIKIEGNEQDLEAAMMNLERVTADLRLTKLKHVS